MTQTTWTLQLFVILSSLLSGSSLLESIYIFVYFFAEKNIANKITKQRRLSRIMDELCISSTVTCLFSASTSSNGISSKSAGLISTEFHLHMSREIIFNGSGQCPYTLEKKYKSRYQNSSLRGNTEMARLQIVFRLMCTI